VTSRTDELVQRLDDLEVRLSEARKAKNTRLERVLRMRRSQAIAELAMQGVETAEAPVVQESTVDWTGVAILVGLTLVVAGAILWWRW
jgi:hypothetical protein